MKTHDSGMIPHKSGNGILYTDSTRKKPTKNIELKWVNLVKKQLPRQSVLLCAFFLQVSIKPWGIIKEAQHIFQSRPFASSNPTQNKQTFVFKPKPI